MKKKSFSILLAVLILAGLTFVAGREFFMPMAEREVLAESKDDKKSEKMDEKKDKEAKDEKKAAPAPDEEGSAGFTEVPIGDEVEEGPLTIGAVYFQPVDMEPAGNSLSKEEADCHIEADIHANKKGTELGFGVGEFVPYLKVKCTLQKVGSDKVQEIAFMPMNASDGPHYGANVKFEEGLGRYKVKYEISAPGNEYLLHVDKETGVEGEFWTDPIETEWEMEWTGPLW